MKSNWKIISILVLIIFVLIGFNTVNAADELSDNATELSSYDSSTDTLTLSADDNTLAAANDNIIYVYPYASSGGNGSKEKPYNSINTAKNNIKSGVHNEIILMSGTYSGYYNNYITINSNDLTIRADDGANPIVDFTYGSSSNNKWTISGSHIKLEGITFKNLQSLYGYMLTFNSQTTDSSVVNCSFTVDRGYGAMYFEGGRNFAVENSTFKSIYPYSNSAVYVRNMNNFTLSNNVIDGFKSYSTGNGYAACFINSDALVENNTIRNINSYYGAIYSDKKPLKVNNNTFIDCTGEYGAGVYLTVAGNEITDNVFINNRATSSGGAIYVGGTKNKLNNNSFYNCSAKANGGAIYLNSFSSGTDITDSIFDNCSASSGGAIFINSNNNPHLLNDTFINCKSNTGGAIYISSTNVDIENSTLINNTASSNGGAIYHYEYTDVYSTLTLKNNTVSHNTAHKDGGAIYTQGAYINVYNNTFENNTAKGDGGVFKIVSYESSYYVHNSVTKMQNNTFNNNTASNGGVLYSYKIKDSLFDNNTYTNNNATIGGAIFIDYPRNNGDKSENIIINNSNFENNTAYAGGAVVLYSSNSIISNSTFTNNNASHYGGGAISSGGANNVIVNNTFINNTALLYGGAIGTNNTLITNNTFINNSAYQAGAILTINSTISYNRFDNNNATRGKDIVYIDKYKYYTTKVICNCTNCSDCKCTVDNCNCTNATMTMVTEDLLIDNDNLNKSTVYEYYDNKILKVAHQINDVYFLYSNPSITNGDYFYKAYCIEQNTTRPWGYNGTTGIFVEDLTFVRNSLDKSYVGDYIKVLIILYQKEIYNLKDYIYVFTDGDYKNSNDPVIKTVINFTNDESTLLLNGMNFVNGTFSCYWFSSFINPTTRQNLILINGCSRIELPGLLPVKQANVTKADPNSDVKYTITVYNNHNVTLHNVTVRDVLGSGNWYIKDWVNTYNDDWVRTSDNSWVLTRSLKPGDFARFDVICHVRTTSGSNLYNSINVFSHETTTYSASSSIKSSGTSLSIQKIALEKTVVAGELAHFKIIVTNTGKEKSGKIKVEDSYSNNDWTYVGWSNDVGSWDTNGYGSSGSTYRRTFTLMSNNGCLNPGESASFFVYFKTPTHPSSHYLSNSATLFEDNTQKGQSYDGVEVYVPEFHVVKNVQGSSTVNVGDTICFRIDVGSYYLNNGMLEGIYVEDIIPEGLTYTGSFSGYGWTYTGGYDYSSSTNHFRWSYKYPLTSNNPYASSLYIYCRATKTGSGVNYVTAYAEGQDPKQSSITYNVVGPSISINKITNNETVYVGEQVSYTIKVKNNGSISLNDVVVSESIHHNLVYDHFIDASGKWIKGNQETWTYNGTLDIGETSQFTVVFNTTAVGNQTNVVSVSTKEGPRDESYNTTNVIIRELTVEKICENPVVSNGSNVTFTIKVKNTYDSVIHDIFVKESDIDGLKFLNWTAILGSWKYNETSKIFTFDYNLYPNQVASFNITYQAVKTGRHNNVIIYGSNETKNFTAENHTFVKDPKIKVEKITLTPIVYLGNEIKFLIQVTNTGNIDLKHVYVNETDFGNLTYLRYNNVKGIWGLVNNSGMYHFILYQTLTPNSSASFEIVFGANKTGNYTNTIVAGNDDVNNTKVKNTTAVEECKLAVEKITVDKIVNLNDNVTFTIKVKNIGTATLTDITVKEYSYYGLEYVNYTSNKGNWTYENGIFKLNGNLSSRDTASFNVTFKALIVGNLTNVVVATYDNSRNVTANNTTSVIHANMTVSKITINPIVNYGDNVTFTIIIKNTGHYELDDVFVHEKSFEGLTYLNYTSDKGKWIYENGIFKLNGTLKEGAEASFNVTFNAQTYGNLTNIIIAGSNETNNITANNTTFVRNPGLSIEKISLNLTSKINDIVKFMVIVKNTGNIDLTNVFVKEIPDAGLIYANEFSPIKGTWFIENDLFKLDGSLAHGENASFIISFKTISRGNLTNLIEAGSNQTNNQTANNTTFVKNPELTVEKITVNKTVYLGENVIFTIIVRNTGDTDLTDVYVREIKHDYLTFVGYTNGNRNWTCNGEIFKLSGELLPGEYASFNVIYRTEKTGSLENTVQAASNQTEIIFTNNNTLVKKNDSDISHPKIVISKEKITKSAVVGDKVIFRIIIKNIGNVDLNDVSFLEKYPSVLKYIGFKGNGWSVKSNIFKYIKTLKVNETVSVDIIFEALKAGSFTNNVIAYIGENPDSNDSSIIHVVDKKNNLPPRNHTLKHDKNSSIVFKSKNIEKISLKPTGNPIMLLLVILAVIGVYPVKKRK